MRKIILILFVFFKTFLLFSQDDGCYKLLDGYIIKVSENISDENSYTKGADWFFKIEEPAITDSTDIFMFINESSILVDLSRVIYNNLFEPIYILDSICIYDLLYLKKAIKDTCFNNCKNKIMVMDILVHADPTLRVLKGLCFSQFKTDILADTDPLGFDF